MALLTPEFRCKAENILKGGEEAVLPSSKKL
jgi:hypothetical protein